MVNKSKFFIIFIILLFLTDFSFPRDQRKKVNKVVSKKNKVQKKKINQKEVQKGEIEKNNIELLKKIYNQVQKKISDCERIESRNYKDYPPLDNFESIYHKCRQKYGDILDPDILGWEDGYHGFTEFITPQDEIGSFFYLEDEKQNKIKIYRIKNASLISSSEYGIYKYLIKKGGFDLKVLFEYTDTIQSGSQLLKYISYDHFVYLLQKMGEDQILNNLFNFSTPRLKFPSLFSKIHLEEKKRVVFSNKFIKRVIEDNLSIRFNIIDSMLGGIFNLDPRVRLLSVHMLRRLIPEAKIWDYINSRVVQIEQYAKTEYPNVTLDAEEETVQYNYYSYYKITNPNLPEIIYDQFVLLRRFTSRFVLVNQIVKGYDIDIISKMNLALYDLIASRIEEEGYCKIPINYFSNHEEVQSLLLGFENNVFPEIKRSLFISLLRVVRIKDTDPAIKISVFKNLVKSDLANLLIKDWEPQEIQQVISVEKDLEKLFHLYISKNIELRKCTEWPMDQYDYPDYSNEPNYSEEDILGNPLTREDYINNFYKASEDDNVEDKDKDKNKDQEHEDIDKIILDKILENMIFDRP